MLSISACATIQQGYRADDAQDASIGDPALEESALAEAIRASEAPHVYMDVQYDGSGPVSAIFAVDYSKDGTPSDDPAIRLTPDNGKCNPQILRYYRFPPTAAARPVYSQNVALMDGVAMEQLPDLMAVEVTAEMLRRGLISDPRESRPQNVCSRKLWLFLVENEDLDRRPAPKLPEAPDPGAAETASRAGRPTPRALRRAPRPGRRWRGPASGGAERS